MRSLILSFLLLNSMAASGQTSTYHPFPESEAVWNMHFGWYCFMNGTGNIDYSIATAGDTIIQSENYTKLITPFADDNSSGNCGGVNVGYRGAYRHDLQNRIVFYVPPLDTTEQLLYDFTMEVGDTVKGYTSVMWGEENIVQSIDSVLVGSDYRKRWNINQWYFIQIIEGVGSTYGLIEQAPGNVTDMPDYSLTCFKENGNVLYPVSASPCQLITDVEPIEASTKEVRLFPNPSNGTITISTDIAVKGIKVTDVLGKVIFQDLNVTQAPFQVDGLPSGIFHLTIMTKDGQKITRKIISKSHPPAQGKSHGQQKAEIIN